MRQLTGDRLTQDLVVSQRLRIAPADDLLGVVWSSAGTGELTDEDRRDIARSGDELAAQGYEIEDTPEGPILRRI